MFVHERVITGLHGRKKSPNGLAEQAKSRNNNEPALVTMSSLDFTSVEESVESIIAKIGGDNKTLFKTLYTLVMHLKSLRSLYGMNSFLSSNESSSLMLDKTMQIASSIISAENIFLFQLDSTELEYIVTHSQSQKTIGIKILKGKYS